MACEDIEDQLDLLRAEKADAEASLAMMPPHKKDLVEANITRIQGEIQREEANLADCLADAANSSTGEVSLRTAGFVGTVEVETKGTARVWFGLTESKDTADWIKIGPVRAWFTLNLEATDRPFYMAQLPLTLEALRSGLHVEVSHGGAITAFHKWDPNDSFAVDSVRVVRAPMRIST
jgi:hypothetical protein